jgi:hypothetical protein
MVFRSVFLYAGWSYLILLFELVSLAAACISRYFDLNVLLTSPSFATCLQGSTL